MARRILVVSPDAAMGQALAGALARVAGAALEVRAPTDGRPTGDALVIVHVVGALAHSAADLGEGGPIIAVLPRAGLGAVVELLQASPRVVGVTVADGPDELDRGELAALVAGILADDSFGLAKVLAAGAEVHTHAVRHYDDKQRCMAAVMALADRRGIARKFREPIEQALDEMLMNALYHAPVDASGKQVFAGMTARDRIALRTQQTVVVEYACDGTQFAIGVRDAYGSLGRDVVLRYLYKCLHSSEKVDRKAGGAGLGLYLMLSSSSAVYFHLLPGVATEAICVFDLDAPKLALESFGCLVQTQPRGLVGAGPARTRPASAKRRIAIAAAALVVVGAVLAGVLAWPKLFPAPVPTHASVTFQTAPPGATIEVEGRTVGIAQGGTLVVDGLEIGRRMPVRASLVGHAPAEADVLVRAGGSTLALTLQPIATLELESEPSGATVAIAGTLVGTTPTAITTLAPGTTVAVAFARVGYESATTQIAVPQAGEVKRHVQPLVLSDDFVRVRFETTPAGAEVLVPGAPPSVDHTYTPAERFVPVGATQSFLLTMPRRVPVLVEVVGKRGAPVVETHVLVPGVVVRVEAAAPGGTATVARAPHCRALAVPFDCTLAPGRYAIEYVGEGGEKTSRDAVVADADLTVRF